MKGQTSQVCGEQEKVLEQYCSLDMEDYQDLARQGQAEAIWREY